MEEKHLAGNRLHWDTLAAIHQTPSEIYRIDEFKAGVDQLNSIEIEGLGEVEGLSLLHLQCHFGMDTLCWARRGAQVTGLDFSPVAVQAAKDLASEVGINANFICANVYDAPKHLPQPFDRVFTSYGALAWLPDLQRWAEVVKQCCKIGGRLFIAEFHPLIYTTPLDGTLALSYPYFKPEQPFEEQSKGSYANPEADTITTHYSWNYSFEELFEGLLSQGFKMRSFKEYDYSPYSCFGGMEAAGEGKWRFINIGEKRIPYVYSTCWERME